LGNGKIIGTRSLRYIYKQRFRPTDDRESVVVNKLSLEYRKLKAIRYGDEDANQIAVKGKISQEVIQSQIKQWKKMIASDLKVGMKRGKHIKRPQI
jgi:predicted DNA-binding protein (UPF0251 family)